MNTNVPGPATNVQDVISQPEPVANVQVPTINNVEAPASTPPPSTEAVKDANDSLKNHSATLGHGYQEWTTALTSGELGTVPPFY